MDSGSLGRALRIQLDGMEANEWQKLPDRYSTRRRPRKVDQDAKHGLDVDRYAVIVKYCLDAALQYRAVELHSEAVPQLFQSDRIVVEKFFLLKVQDDLPHVQSRWSNGGGRREAAGGDHFDIDPVVVVVQALSDEGLGLRCAAAGRQCPPHGGNAVRTCGGHDLGGGGGAPRGPARG